MSEHRPWMVAIPRTEIGGREKVSIAMTSPRRTSGLRRIVIPSNYGYMLRILSLKLGSIETGRELLDTGPIPGSVLSELMDVETFDMPVERGQTIWLVVENVSEGMMFVEGVLLGLGERS